MPDNEILQSHCQNHIVKKSLRNVFRNTREKTMKNLQTAKRCQKNVRLL